MEFDEQTLEYLASLSQPPEVEKYIDRIKAEHWGVRAFAAKTLGLMGEVAAVEPLCSALKDEDQTVRYHVVIALARIKSAQAIEPLSALLHDAHPTVRAAAGETIALLGNVSSVEALCAALKSEDMNIRVIAAKMFEQMGKVGDTRAVERLCAALKDENREARAWAAVALGKIGDIRAVAALCFAVQDESHPVRFAAAKALGQIGSAIELPLRILTSPTLTPAQRLDALEALKIAQQHDEWKDVRFAFHNVRKSCQKLCRQEGVAEDVRHGAKAVLAELQRRADARELGRAGQREETRDPQELLRGQTGETDTASAGELLRSSRMAETQNYAEKPGMLSRIFKRKQ